jgi:hypothetical protein
LVLKTTLELKVIADIYVTNRQMFRTAAGRWRVVRNRSTGQWFFFTDVRYGQIESSFNDFNGISQINGGSMNNQANIVSPAVTDKENA